ncbi:MAG TPA: hypothetical protein VMU90_12135 [Solirubrobacteraceae bacterium]|nr:hypothetical protein [Solirubrobacteraceae bacterium]
MATRIQMDFSGLNLADYDKVCEALNFPSDWPDGLLAHTSAEVDGRLRVVDIWESPGQFDGFVEGRLGPAIGGALGDRAEQPQRSDRELYTFYAK